MDKLHYQNYTSLLTILHFTAHNTSSLYTYHSYSHTFLQFFQMSLLYLNIFSLTHIPFNSSVSLELKLTSCKFHVFFTISLCPLLPVCLPHFIASRHPHSPLPFHWKGSFNIRPPYQVFWQPLGLEPCLRWIFGNEGSLEIRPHQGLQTYTHIHTYSSRNISKNSHFAEFANAVIL